MPGHGFHSLNISGMLISTEFSSCLTEADIAAVCVPPVDGVLAALWRCASPCSLFLAKCSCAGIYFYHHHSLDLMCWGHGLELGGGVGAAVEVRHRHSHVTEPLPYEKFKSRSNLVALAHLISFCSDTTALLQGWYSVSAQRWCWLEDH